MSAVKSAEIFSVTNRPFCFLFHTEGSHEVDASILQSLCVSTNDEGNLSDVLLKLLAA